MPLRLDNAKCVAHMPTAGTAKNKSFEPRFKIDHAAAPMPETKQPERLAPRATSNRNGGRDHLGILGEIKSEHPGEIIGIRSLIENIKELPGKAAQGAHIRVGIKLAEPTSPEGKVLAALTDGLNTAIVSLSRKVAPALDSTGKATHASDSCIRCLEACKLIVLPPDDPFAQIACMLGCADCP
jgi:hypothetical protein